MILLRGKIRIMSEVDKTLSPSSKPSPSAQPVSLNSSIRTTPIHPLLPDVRIPGEPLPAYKYHPVTCTPIDSDEVRSQLEQLRKEYPTEAAALKAQEQTAKELKKKIEDAEEKREKLQREMDKKQKERDTELKVLSKYQQVKASDIPS